MSMRLQKLRKLQYRRMGDHRGHLNKTCSYHQLSLLAHLGPHEAFQDKVSVALHTPLR